MKLIKKIRKEPRPKQSDTYIDLGELEEMGAFEEGDSGKMLKVAELHKYEDLHQIITMVYNGDVILIDYTPVSMDELLLKRITAELKQVARDVGGDVAGLKKNLLVVTPAGFRIDRKILRGSSGFF